MSRYRNSSRLDGDAGGAGGVRRGTRWLAALSALLLASFGALVATPAQAATVGGVQTSFAIDGDKLAPDDWEAFYGPGLTPGGLPTTGIIDSYANSEACRGDGTTTEDPTISGTNSQTINSNPWQMSPGPYPNEKSDLCSAGAAYEIVDVNGQQHVILYQYWTRAPEGTGDLSINYSFEGGAPGRDGDRLVQFNVNPNGTTNAIGMIWDGVSWVQTPNITFEAAVGTNPDFPGSQDDTFGEMAIDLTASGLLPETGCLTFTTGDIVTQTGNATTGGQLQDFMSGGDSLTIGSCGPLTVQKEVTGPVPEGTLFDYLIDREDGLATHGATRPARDTDGSTSTVTAQIEAGGSHTYTDLIAQPDYRVAELVASLPTGVTGLSVVCTYQNPFLVGSPQQTTTVWENGAYTGNTFVLSAATLGLMTPVCVITNQVTSLTLDKIVVNDDGGTATGADFPLTATGSGGVVLTGADTDSDGGSALTALVGPGGYTLSEQSLDGYTAGAWSCTGGSLQGDVVTIAAGEAVTCAITNDDQPAHLTLVKDVVNDDGGTAIDTDFTLTASGPTPISGAEGDAAVTDAEVSAGTYTIAEEALAGYELTGIQCWTDDTRQTEVPVTDGQIALGSGGSAYCELTNDDLPGSLQLIKEVVNADGGTAAPGDWTLSADGPTPISGAGGVGPVDVSAGTYTLSETGGAAGYEAGTWMCSGATAEGDTVVVPNGAAVVCTIVNDDIAPRLTLVKEVVNDDGGTAAATDWTLTATGPVEITGATGDAAITGAAVQAGAYELTESGPGGYDAGDWSCTGGSLQGATLTLGLDQNVTCTIVNDDIAPRLTLIKQVVNDDGGTAVATQWTLTADGPTPISGATGSGAVTDAAVEAGVYTLSEDGPAGYSASDWSCTGGTLDVDQLTLAVGEVASCTIVNDDIAALLTLVKAVVNDDGGTAADTDFTLTADGPTPISGAESDPAVTAAPVSAGSYSIGEAAVDGYTLLGISCWTDDTRETALDVVQGQLELGSGDTAYCELTNDDLPAALTLVKEVVNDDGGTAVDTDFTLTADGPTPISGAEGDAAVTDALVSAGTYTLGEEALAGYELTGILCWTDDTRETTVTVTGGTIDLANGGSAYCELTNDDIAPLLTLVKAVVNDDGGTAVDTDFTLTATGPTSIGGSEGDGAVTMAPVTAGTYLLGELPMTGYALVDVSCWTDDSRETAVPVADSQVALANGATAYCELTNDDIAPLLTLVKEVVNDDGGTAADTDFTLSADGPTPISGVSGEDAVTTVPVTAGEYALGETGPAGYAPGDWGCDGGALAGSSLTLEVGDVVVCTIVNDDLPGELTLIKDVVTDDGGELDPSAWTLTAEGPVTITGVTGDPSVTDAIVPAGDYTLSEDGPAGYEPGVWVCDGGMVTAEGVVTVPNGGDVTCTIVNDDIAPHLTLIKEVVNDDGGTAAATEWTLTADGPSDISGATGDATVTGAAVLAGEYALGETGPAGYSAGAWSCEGGSLDGSTLTLEVGEDAVCTIVNDDIAPLLTLVKQVVNDDGGDLGTADFPLTAEGPDTITGVSGDPAVTAVAVTAGEYALSETTAAGYTAGAWSCVGGSLDGSTLTLGVGDEVVCTIVNDDLPVDLALTKDDGGATAANGGSFDYTITVENIGDRAADLDEPVTVVDQLPEGMVFVSGPEQCSAVDRTITCDVDPALLGVGGTVELVLTVAFEADAPAGEYENIAWVTTDDDPAPEEPECPSESNNVDCEPTPLQLPTLTLVKIVLNDEGGEAEPGDFVLTATGPVTITGVTGDEAVTAAEVPAGVYTLSETGPQGYDEGVWTCLGGTLEGDVVTIVGIVDAVCTVSNPDRPVDLQLTKDDGGVTAEAGDEFDYTITVANTSGRDVDADDPVTVVDELPEGMAYVSGPKECTADGRTVTCELDPTQLTAGASVVLELTVRFEPDAPAGEYVNLAYVTTEDDPAPEEPECPEVGDVAVATVSAPNVDCEETPLVAGTLDAEKSVWEQDGDDWIESDGMVDFGDVVRYQIALTAGGDALSRDVVVVDELEDGLESLLPASCSVECEATYDEDTATHRIEIAEIEEGTVVTVTFDAMVPDAPALKPGEKVETSFDNVAAVSTRNQPETPTNTVTVTAKASKAPVAPPLPQTGGEIGWGNAALGGGLLLAGWLLLARSRRRVTA
jgi:uncharacterized repeat protein (TIGR01451 family)/LPXTG-motif cell wall-anchored protein/fimbrial isopeptide formation D2 family protein